MRHKKSRRKLGRPTDERVALVNNQVSALFEHGYLNTTLPRAKAVQSVAEKLISKAKRGDLGSIRQCARVLPTKQSLRNLLRRVAPAMQEVPSGYTQIARMKYRRGDGALIVRLSLTRPLASEKA
ncbi:50S ribosomal protein L17 [bacterium]|nr:50S ribosomal protein L17 [bacterium]